MHTLIFGTLARLAAIALLVLGAPFSLPAAAQERPKPTLDLTAGWIGFADDGVVSESLLGGAARWYVLPRLSVGPEALYLSGENHGHLILTGNVMYDLLRPMRGRPNRVTPFIVAGGGLFQTREDLFNGTFTSREGAFTAGGGVRTFVGDGVTMGIDMRVGWETHVRVGGVMGFTLGR